MTITPDCSPLLINTSPYISPLNDHQSFRWMTHTTAQSIWTYHCWCRFPLLSSNRTEDSKLHTATHRHTLVIPATELSRFYGGVICPFCRLLTCLHLTKMTISSEGHVLSGCGLTRYYTFVRRNDQGQRLSVMRDQPLETNWTKPSGKREWNQEKRWRASPLFFLLLLLLTLCVYTDAQLPARIKKKRTTTTFPPVKSTWMESTGCVGCPFLPIGLAYFYFVVGLPIANEIRLKEND